MTDIFDILIIGGGINGAGIARDASGRNLKVCLVEKILLDLLHHLGQQNLYMVD